MSSWARTGIRAVLLGIRTRLVSITGIDDTRVGITVLPPDEVPLFAAYQDVLLRVLGEQPDEGIIDGTGRWDNRRDRALQVAIRTRVSLDQAGKDHSRLTDASLGHVLLEDLVVEALEVFSVPGDDGDVLTAPLRVGRLSDPARIKTNPDWVWSAFHVEATYSRDLDTSLEAQFGSS